MSQIAAEAAFDGRAEMEAVKHGYEENRRILIEGLPKAGLDKFLPVDGAFYLYADVSRFSDDSLDFAKRMLEEAHVAATPGIDFDPVHGRHFVRFCYAGSAAEMHEAVERIGELAQTLALRSTQFRYKATGPVFLLTPRYRLNAPRMVRMRSLLMVSDGVVSRSKPARHNPRNLARRFYRFDCRSAALRSGLSCRSRPRWLRPCGRLRFARPTAAAA